MLISDCRHDRAERKALITCSLGPGDKVYQWRSDPPAAHFKPKSASEAHSEKNYRSFNRRKEHRTITSPFSPEYILKSKILQGAVISKTFFSPSLAVNTATILTNLQGSSIPYDLFLEAWLSPVMQTFQHQTHWNLKNEIVILTVADCSRPALQSSSSAKPANDTLFALDTLTFA